MRYGQRPIPRSSAQRAADAAATAAGQHPPYSLTPAPAPADDTQTDDTQITEGEAA